VTLGDTAHLGASGMPMGETTHMPYWHLPVQFLTWGMFWKTPFLLLTLVASHGSLGVSVSVFLKNDSLPCYVTSGTCIF
jgi:hypothetical protein